MVLLSYNTTNDLILTNNVSHDTTLPYTLRFVGLADNITYVLSSVVNVSASPSRFLEFSIHIPNDISLNTSQQYRLEIISGDGKKVIEEIAMFYNNRSDSVYNDSTNTIRKFYE